MRLFLALFVFTTIISSTPNSRAGTALFECKNFKSKLPLNYAQGYVLVPENWDHPEGKKIKVFYYGRLKGTDKNSVPVVFFNGGPSNNSHSSYLSFEVKNSPIKSIVKSMPFIYLDQRGTGCSDPYPIPTNFESVQNMTNYGSRAIVKDAEEIRKKLFGENSKWKIFGHSYGAFIVKRYIALVPEHVEKAYAHGFGLMPDSYEWLRLRILSQKEIGLKYLELYPEDFETLKTLRSKILSTDCFELVNNEKLCGPGALDVASVTLSFKDLWLNLHEWIASLLNKDGTINEKNLSAFIKKYGVLENTFALSLIATHEMVPNLSFITMCEKISSHPEEWLFNECRLKRFHGEPLDSIFNSFLKSEFYKPDILFLDELKTSLRRYPDLKYFLYSGELDSMVPPPIFKEEVETLGSLVNYKKFHNSGHGGYISELQIWQDLLKN